MTSIGPQTKIGFIGLGLMGRPMALNIRKAGFPLTVWNRTPERADEVVAAGAKLASSPAEVAANSDLVISIVSDPPALEEILWGPHGAMNSFHPGSIYIDSSTISPTLAEKVSAQCREKNVRFLDAPVTGGDWGAKKGELVFMVGGDASTLTEAEPIIRVMGKKWFHLGPNGSGQIIKLAMNLILALQVDALAESLALVTAAGLQGEKLVEVLQSSMARSGVLDVKAPNLLKGEYTPSFPLRLMHKDIRLGLELAKQVNVDLPAAAAAFKTYSKVKDEAKDQDLDYSAVMKYWKK